MLTEFHQHMKCAIRGANTLDKVDSNIKLGCRLRLLPHLGQYDHMSLHLIPAYVPLQRTALTITKLGLMVPLSSYSSGGRPIRGAGAQTHQLLRGKSK